MIKKGILSACVLFLMIGFIGIGACGKPITGDKPLGEGLFIPEKTPANEKINDLSNAYKIILEKGTRDFYEGYPIDQSFLHWVEVQYGESVIMDIAYKLYDGNADKELWYTYTGNSLHVLWLLYCQDLRYATYYLDNVHWLECASDDVITIDFTGDINLAADWHTMRAAATKENGIYDCISKEIIEELQAADLSVINNEFVFSDGGDRQANKGYTFRAPIASVSMLEVFGADLANLANNHTYDFRESGLMDTIATLDGAGIETMGAGANIYEASAIKYYVANGKKIAFVSATQIERYSRFTKEATETEAGVLKCLDPEIYNAVIREAAENSDYVIASVHWGAEGTYQYGRTEYRLAEGFVENGADIIIGGHPHRMQGVEYINNVPVVFSIGNFWFSTGTLYTTIAQVQIDKAGEISLKLIPCIQKDLTTRMLTEEEAVGFYKFLADVSVNIVFDENGYIHNTKYGQNLELINGINIFSGIEYGTHNGRVDLDGYAIDNVGNRY